MALVRAKQVDPCAVAAKGHGKKECEKSGVWTRPLQTREQDSADVTDSGPAWHTHLRQQIKAAALGVKLTSLNR
jgi:hypothetical protein